MNMVSQTTRIARTQWSIAVPAVDLPIYLRLMLLVTTFMAAALLSWTIPLRQDLQPSYPFSNYVDIFPGKPQSGMEALRFSCEQSNTWGEREYCTRVPADGPFSLIAINISNGIVQRVNFAVLSNTLMIGDLTLLWGRPRIRLYRQSAIFEWSSIGARAIGWAESAHFSNFIPILNISLNAQPIDSWGDMY